MNLDKLFDILFVKNRIKKIIYWLSPSPFLFRICNWYVNYYKGENNADFFSNGESEFLNTHLAKCKLVFDVGANVGNWAEMALNINSAIEIHCFEPGKLAFGSLRNKIFPKKVYINNFGFGAIVESKTLYIVSENSRLSSLYHREGLGSLGLKPNRKETIEIRTIDDYCNENNISNIDLLKIDVEGYELEVFRGATRMFKEGKIKRIQFEYGPTNIDARVLLKDLLELLYEYKYEVYKIHPKGLFRIKEYDQQYENYQYKNFVAIRTQ